MRAAASSGSSVVYLARPNIVMFGDNGWLPQRSLPQRANQAAWLEHAKATKARLVVIEVGAGSVIASVRDFGRRMCDDLGAHMIRINPREFKVEGRGDVGCFDGRTGIALPASGDASESSLHAWG